MHLPHHSAWWQVMQGQPGQQALMYMQRWNAHLSNCICAPGPWVVILASGGHFAAAVFQRCADAQGEVPCLKVAEHKTFHRYVVRCACACWTSQLCRRPEHFSWPDIGLSSCLCIACGQVPG